MSLRPLNSFSFNSFYGFCNRTGCLFFYISLFFRKKAFHVLSEYRKKRVVVVLWFLLGRMRVTSQQLNINRTDKVFRRVEPFWEELRAHRIWGQLQLLLNPCLTPYRDPEGLTGKDRGLRRSFRQMKMMHGFLHSLTVSLRCAHISTHTILFLPVLYLLRATLYTHFSLSLFLSLAAVQLLRRHLSSRWLRQEQAD